MACAECQDKIAAARSVQGVFPPLETTTNSMSVKKQVARKRKETFRPLSLFLPAGLADLFIERDARTVHVTRQQVKLKN